MCDINKQQLTNNLTSKPFLSQFCSLFENYFDGSIHQMEFAHLTYEWTPSADEDHATWSKALKQPLDEPWGEIVLQALFCVFAVSLTLQRKTQVIVNIKPININICYVHFGWLCLKKVLLSLYEIDSFVVFLLWKKLKSEVGLPFKQKGDNKVFGEMSVFGEQSWNQKIWNIIFSFWYHLFLRGEHRTCY